MGSEERNENVDRFGNLYVLYKLATVGIIFPHNRIHKATRASPNYTTEIQIVHICISKKFARLMENVRTTSSQLPR